MNKTCLGYSPIASGGCGWECRFSVLIRMALMACVSIWVGGCGADSSGSGQAHPTAIHAQVILPEYPFVKNGAIRIDHRLLDSLAGTYLETGGLPEDVTTFMFAFLPTWAFAHISDGGLPNIEDLEGLLYLSGFFGGVWLKDILNPPTSGYNPSGTRAVQGLDLDTCLFSLVAALAGAQIRTARTAARDELLQYIFQQIEGLVYLYGYNRGYLQSILDHPPKGVTPPAGYLVCSGFLDCRTPVPGIPILAELLPLAQNIEEPPDARWAEMKRKTYPVGPKAEEMGYEIWTSHLSVEGIGPQDYRTLLDLSAGFLGDCQVAVLMAMKAWVGEEEETGRTAVAVSAGMSAWAGGYAIGLVSSVAGGQLPRIVVIPE